MSLLCLQGLSQNWGATGPSTLFARNSSLSVSPVNVGIGTSTPVRQLHTTGSVRLSGITSNLAATRILLQDSTGDLYYRDATSLVATTWLLTGNAGTNPSTNFLGTTDNQRLVFRTNNTEKFTILASGYAGLNTSAPTGTLTVRGANTADNAGVLIEQRSGSTLGAYLTLDNRASTGGKAWSIGSTGTSNTPAMAGVLEFNQYGVGTRMLIDSLGRVGIGLGNGVGPTAFFHTKGTVRHQNLPAGTGTILVVDSNGYVYRSSSSALVATADQDMPEVETLDNEIRELRIEIENLKKLLSVRESSTNTKLKPSNKPYLSVNSPNPFKNATTVKYYVPGSLKAGTSFLAVHTLSGNLVKRYPINKEGSGQVLVSNPGNTAGMYVYSLEIDGKTVDSKKMTVAGN